MEHIDQSVEKELGRCKAPGVTYEFFDLEAIKYSYQRGYANLERKIPVGKETTFSAFSITKTFTALAVMQLVETGRVSIDDQMIKYLPGFRFLESATIRQVLAHTAGIPSPIPLKWVHLLSEHQGFDEKAFFEEQLSKHAKLKSKPNEKWSYSNLGYYLLGLLVERISGISYKDYVHLKIMDLLLLEKKSLGFEIDENTHATGYQRKGFLNFLLGFFFDKAKFMESSHDEWIPFKSFYINGSAFGGILATSAALVKYGQELLKSDSRLLSYEFKKLLFTPGILNNGKEMGICLCWYWGELNGNFYVEHIGGACGFYSELRLYPALGKGSVLMMNRTGIMPEKILDRVDIYFL